MSILASPRTVFERLIRGITAGDWDRLPDLYAEDAVVDLPFALPRPVHLVGRAQIRAHFAAASQVRLRFVVRKMVVHETADPQTIIAEYDYEATATDSGRSFVVPNIQVLRMRDGLIASSRDFHHHVALAQAAGRLPELLTALTSPE